MDMESSYNAQAVKGIGLFVENPAWGYSTFHFHTCKGSHGSATVQELKPRQTPCPDSCI